MAISEFEVKRWEKAIGLFMAKRRPPVHIRDKLDLGYRIENQSVEIFEIRPRWDRPSEKMESPVARATYSPEAVEGLLATSGSEMACLYALPHRQRTRRVPGDRR